MSLDVVWHIDRKAVTLCFIVLDMVEEGKTDQYGKDYNSILLTS